MGSSKGGRHTHNVHEVVGKDKMKKKNLFILKIYLNLPTISTHTL